MRLNKSDKDGWHINDDCLMEISNRVIHDKGFCQQDMNF